MEEKTEVFKRVASEAKDRQWKSFCNTLNRDTTLTHFWQFYRQMEGCTNTPDLIDAGGAVLKTSKENSSALLQRFVHQSNPDNLDETKAVWKGLDRTLTEAGSNDDLITELEFTEALSGLSKDTASGPDKVKYSGIKNLSVDNKSELFRLYEESFATGHVTKDWSHSYPKPDRLVGLVVRRPPRERKIPGSNPACAGIFSGLSHTSDLKIGTPLAVLPGAWRDRVSAWTGRLDVSIL